jgi:hypothetical protein
VVEMLDLPCLSGGREDRLFVVSITRRWDNDRRSRTFPGRLCKPCARALIAQAEEARARTKSHSRTQPPEPEDAYTLGGRSGRPNLAASLRLRMRGAFASDSERKPVS